MLEKLEKPERLIKLASFQISTNNKYPRPFKHFKHFGPFKHLILWQKN